MVGRHYRIQPKGLLCDAKRDLLAIAKFLVIYLRQGGGICFCRRSFVRLSVCLWASYSKTPEWFWMKCCVSTDVGTWTNWLTFEPDPDYSPDAGTGLLSPISYVVQRGNLLRRENPTYRCWYTYRSLQRRVVLKWFYSPRAVGTPLSEVHALHRVPF